MTRPLDHDPRRPRTRRGDKRRCVILSAEKRAKDLQIPTRFRAATTWRRIHRVDVDPLVEIVDGGETGSTFPLDELESIGDLGGNLAQATGTLPTADQHREDRGVSFIGAHGIAGAREAKRVCTESSGEVVNFHDPPAKSAGDQRPPALAPIGGKESLDSAAGVLSWRTQVECPFPRADQKTALGRSTDGRETSRAHEFVARQGGVDPNALASRCHDAAPPVPPRARLGVEGRREPRKRSGLSGGASGLEALEAFPAQPAQRFRSAQGGHTAAVVATAAHDRETRQPQAEQRGCPRRRGPITEQGPGRDELRLHPFGRRREAG